MRTIEETIKFIEENRKVLQDKIDEKLTSYFLFPDITYIKGLRAIDICLEEVLKYINEKD